MAVLVAVPLRYDVGGGVFLGALLGADGGERGDLGENELRGSAHPRVRIQQLQHQLGRMVRNRLSRRKNEIARQNLQMQVLI